MSRSNSVLGTLRKIGREQSLATLRNVGNVCRSKTFASKRDKALCPRRQRKTRDWSRGD